MRKLLLGGAAILSLSGMATSGAFAQVVPPGQGINPSLGNIGPARTVATTPDGFFESGITVNLHGFVEWYAGDTGVADMNSASAGAAKVSGAGFAQLWRLKINTDIVAANGLKYGAFAEIRTYNTGAGTSDGLKWNKAFGYVGTDRAGTIRFGMTPGPSMLFMQGNFENFGDGGWNGNVAGILNSTIWGAPGRVWTLQDGSAYYRTNKIEYLSPAFFSTGANTGLDFAVAFQPNISQNAIDDGSGCPAAVAASACNQLTSSATAGDLSRNKNLVDAGIRYRGIWGLANVGAYVDYIHSSSVSSLVAATPSRKGLDELTAGIQGGYGGLLVGGMVLAGNVNNGVSTTGTNGGLMTQGQRRDDSFLVGASYTINGKGGTASPQPGSIVVGAHFIDNWMAGAQTPANRKTVGILHTYGLATGATYTVAQGLSVFAEYLYGSQQQNGWNLYTGAAGTAHNSTHSNMGAVGVSVVW